MPAHAAKADDYGSERFVQVNQCMVDFLQHNPGKTDPQGITLSVCMKNHDYTFLPDAKIFGDSGPKCKNDKLGVFHSWCWSKQ
jgi:hypothetical protein